MTKKHEIEIELLPANEGDCLLITIINEDIHILIDGGTANTYRTYLRERLIQLRNDVPKSFQAIEWIAYASNVFNALVPFYGSISETPDYLSNTTDTVSTDNFYWSSRLIAAMADASYKKSSIHIERYQKNVMAKGHHLINIYDELLQKENDLDKQLQLKHQANQKIADMLKEETNKTISLVLNELSLSMKNKFERSDA